MKCRRATLAGDIQQLVVGLNIRPRHILAVIVLLEWFRFQQTPGEFHASQQDSSVKFLAVASKAFARPAAAPERPGMITRGKERGTVSSTLIALGKKPRDAIFQYANGSPDVAKYEDYSPLLRDILSRGLREARTKVSMSD